MTAPERLDLDALEKLLKKIPHDTVDYDDVGALHWIAAETIAELRAEREAREQTKLEGQMPWKAMHKSTLVKLLKLEEAHERLRKAAEAIDQAVDAAQGTDVRAAFENLRAALAAEGEE